MDAKTRAMLRAKGWAVGGAREFLGMSAAQESFVDTRLNLLRALLETRKARGWTQAQLAEAMGTGQPRVAAMESGDPSTSTDLLLRALFVMGLTRRQVGEAIGQTYVDVEEGASCSNHFGVEVRRAAKKP